MPTTGEPRKDFHGLPRIWQALASRQKVSARSVYFALGIVAILALTSSESRVELSIILLLLLGFSGAGIVRSRVWMARRKIVVNSVSFAAGGSGTLVPESKVARVSLLISLTSATVGISWYGIASYGGPRDRSVGTILAEYAAPPFLLLYVGYLVLFFFGKRKVLGLGMDRGGVYHWWWGGCSYFEWKSIRSVDPVYSLVSPRVDLSLDEGGSTYDNPEENVLGRWAWVRRNTSKIHLGLLAAPSSTTYQALCFYLRSPELREELGDERSVGRMRCGEFGEIPAEIKAHGRALSPEEAAAK